MMFASAELLAGKPVATEPLQFVLASAPGCAREDSS